MTGARWIPANHSGYEVKQMDARQNLFKTDAGIQDFLLGDADGISFADLLIYEHKRHPSFFSTSFE